MEKSDLKYIEQLAAIHIEQKDEETVLNTINNVLDYVSILDTYTLDDTMQVNEQMTEIMAANVNREDAAILLAINAVSDQLKKQKELDDIRDKNKFDGK
jgi:Asp-tRNA(Asn)/Glu-tRNA(Gln) amidotransferase C subunit